MVIHKARHESEANGGQRNASETVCKPRGTARRGVLSLYTVTANNEQVTCKACLQVMATGGR